MKERKSRKEQRKDNNNAIYFMRIINNPNASDDQIRLTSDPACDDAMPLYTLYLAILSFPFLFHPTLP